ncbi:MAG: thiamine pyrophosphate-dependent enzyme [Thermaerobacter sp.]|nr:thiamine pyrophosphate-dependent enzyme [Thermaerobacter sp.]
MSQTQPDWRIDAYRDMVRIREFEETSAKLYTQGLVGGSLHLAIGQEGTIMGTVGALASGDQITMTYRGRGHALAKGADPFALFAEILGRQGGTSRGKGGPMHIYDPEVGVMGTNAIVGAGIPIAVGLALAAKMEGASRVAMTAFGDGAVNQGAFHEGLNLAAIWDLPIVFVCENNLYSEMTPIKDAVRNDSLTERAQAYRIRAVTVDGNDVEAVREVAEQAIARARAGEGPTFIECMTYRYVGHMLGDPETYRSKEEVQSWKERDPILLLREKLLREKAATKTQLDAIEAAAREEIAQAADSAQKSPEPQLEEALDDVF